MAGKELLRSLQGIGTLDAGKVFNPSGAGYRSERVVITLDIEDNNSFRVTAKSTADLDQIIGSGYTVPIRDKVPLQIKGGAAACQQTTNYNS
jgi:hypothetical protein